MRIEGFRRRRRPYRDRLYDDLPPGLRLRAQQWLDKFCKRHKRRLASERWLYPILVGQARRLARTTPEQRSQWGRRMLGRLGGLRVQRLYLYQGRTGKEHPAHKASRISATHRRWRKDEKLREAIGLPPKTRHKYLPIF